MPFTPRQSVVGVVVGSLANVFVIVLGLLLPLTDPSRERVDNALLCLGAVGVLLALLLPDSGIMSRGSATRAALRVYAVASLIAVLVADFGARPNIGWAIKIPTVVVTAVAVHRLARPEPFPTPRREAPLMTDLDAALDAHRKAVAGFVTSAERCEAVWHTPRSPGKWSPAQLSEHVARSLDESANEVAGLPSKFPSFPGLLRFVARGLFFNRVLKTEAFPRARTRPAFNPESGPDSPALARARIEAAAARLEQACRDRARTGDAVRSGLFGAVPVSQYAQFQALHTRHHAKQFPVG